MHSPAAMERRSGIFRGQVELRQRAAQQGRFLVARAQVGRVPLQRMGLPSTFVIERGYQSEGYPELSRRGGFYGFAVSF